MKLTISEGNTKIGSKVPNISLPPGKSCVPGVPCFNGGCYAMKSYRMYPNVQQAWDGNLELWEVDPNSFSEQLFGYLDKAQLSRFRWHVGGDIPDQQYYEMMLDVAEYCPHISFLCFTKRYDLDFTGAPDNLNIMLSAWPGLEFKNPALLPVAWLAEDPRAPLSETHIRCPGGCQACSYKCWGSRLDVIFDKH